MNNNNTIFKDSPLGKIPGDWEVMTLKDCCLVKGEYGINAAAVDYSEELPTYIRITDIDDDGNYSGEKKVSVNDKNSGNFLLSAGDIVFARTGATVGKNYIYDSKDGELVFAGFLIRFRTNENCLLPYYLKYFTSTNLYWNWVKTVSMRSGQPGINAEEYGTVKIPVPPLPEQKAIAQVLGLIDSAIHTNNQLIAKKELQKKWLMQNLLTGKKRLKGYNGEWNEYILKNCFHFIKSYSVSRDGLSREQGQKYCIHYGDIHAYYETDFIDFKTQSGIPRIIDNNVNVHSGDYLLDGDVIIADASEDYDGVGEAVEIINIQDKTVVGGLHTIVLRDFSGVTSKLYRAYLFNCERVRNELRKKATGTSVYSVTKTTLESLVLNLPPLNEQSAIAMVLQEADREIHLLKTKTEKLREQKKGLMQVLLTGKKRLPI